MKIDEHIEKTGHGGFKSLLKKARALGINIKFFPKETSLIKLEYGGRIIFCRPGTIPLNKRQGDMTRNKDLTKTVLREIGIRTPNGVVARSHKEALRLIQEAALSYPLIAKPLDGTRAMGVTWNICSPKDLKKPIDLIIKDKNKTGRLQKATKFLIEEMYAGSEFRVLVFGDHVLSCVQKIAASMAGDGKSTIKELMHKFNKKRMRGFEIKVDTVVKKTLLKNNLTLASVLPGNYTLKLRYNLNMSDGGRAVECTKKMSPFFKKICIAATHATGLTIGGVDLMAKDITASKGSYVILEVNPNPFYNMHEKPLVEGRGVDVSKIILKHLFPRLK